MLESMININLISRSNLPIKTNCSIQFKKLFLDTPKGVKKSDKDCIGCNIFIMKFT